MHFGCETVFFGTSWSLSFPAGIYPHTMHDSLYAGRSLLKEVEMVVELIRWLHRPLAWRNRGLGANVRNCAKGYESSQGGGKSRTLCGEATCDYSS